MERTEDYVKLSLRRYESLKESETKYKKLVEKNFVDIWPCSGNSVVTKNKAVKQLALNAKNDINNLIKDSDKVANDLETKIAGLEALAKTMYYDLSRKNKLRYLKVTMMKDLIHIPLTLTKTGLEFKSRFDY